MTYFMHRIQATVDAVQKGIEVHDSLDSAVLSYWGRMKTAYGKSDNIFVSCKITDENGAVVSPYDTTWLKDGEQAANKFFLHHIRKDGDTFDKAIDIYDTLDAATGDLAVQMEYGYGNQQYPNVTFVSCLITDLLSGGMVLRKAAWVKPQPEPEPEPQPEPEE